MGFFSKSLRSYKTLNIFITFGVAREYVAKKTQREREREISRDQTNDKHYVIHRGSHGDTVLIQHSTVWLTRTVLARRKKEAFPRRIVQLPVCFSWLLYLQKCLLPLRRTVLNAQMHRANYTAFGNKMTSKQTCYGNKFVLKSFCSQMLCTSLSMYPLVTDACSSCHKRLFLLSQTSVPLVTNFCSSSHKRLFQYH